MGMFPCSHARWHYLYLAGSAFSAKTYLGQPATGKLPIATVPTKMQSLPRRLIGDVSSH